MLKKGFTLIEMIVVIAVLTLAIPAVFAIVFSIVNQEVRIARLTQLKKEGDFSMQIMENIIRNNASFIIADVLNNTKKCDQASTTWNSDSGNFWFYDNDQNDPNGTKYFYFNLDSNNKIASFSSVLGGNRYLTSDKVKISQVGSTPFIACVRKAAYSAPVVSINFAVEHAGSDLRPGEIVPTLVYSSNVSLRNY